MGSGDGFLVVRGLKKSYGSVPVLREFEIDIQQGEFVSLLGASGCGKTTFLQVLAGFVDPDPGEVTIRLAGQNLSALPAHRRNIAVVFQQHALFPHLNVRQNVEFGLRMRKVSRRVMDAKVDEMLKLVRLGDHGDRYSHELSGGQQQRVAVARALAIEPTLLLLDEPFSSLDRALRIELRSEIARIQELTGVTTVFVTHDQDEALALSDRIVVMSEGVVEQIGTPAEVYHSPRTEMVAEFLGASNIIGGRIVAGSDGQQLDAGQLGRLGLAGDFSEVIGAARAVAVKPERIELLPAGDGGNRGDSPVWTDGHHNFAAATIVSSEFRGQGYAVRVEVSGQPLSLLVDERAFDRDYSGSATLRWPVDCQSVVVARNTGREAVS